MLQRVHAGEEERLPPGGGRRPRLPDIGAGRIADMDEAGIDIEALLAVTPGARNVPSAALAVGFARPGRSRRGARTAPASPPADGAEVVNPCGQRGPLALSPCGCDGEGSGAA